MLYCRVTPYDLHNAAILINSGFAITTYTVVILPGKNIFHFSLTAPGTALFQSSVLKEDAGSPPAL